MRTNFRQNPSLVSNLCEGHKQEQTGIGYGDLVLYLSKEHMLFAVGLGTKLQPTSSRVQLPMVSLELFNNIILPAALWPWGRLSF